MVTELQQALLQVDRKTEEKLIKVRRDLHARPELPSHEKQTAESVANELDRLPVENLKVGFGGDGPIADVTGPLPGRSVLARADIGRLPVQEASDDASRSKMPEASHARDLDV